MTQTIRFSKRIILPFLLFIALCAGIYFVINHLAGELYILAIIVAIFAFIAPVFFGNRSVYLAPVIMLIVGLSVAGAGYYIVNERMETARTKSITTSAQNYAYNFENNLDLLTHTVLSVSSFYAASDFVYPDEFRTFATQILNRNHEVRGLYYISKPDSEKPAFYAIAPANEPSIPESRFNADDIFLTAQKEAENTGKLALKPLNGNNSKITRLIAFDFVQNAASKNATPDKSGFVAAVFDIESMINALPDIEYNFSDILLSAGKKDIATNKDEEIVTFEIYDQPFTLIFKKAGLNSGNEEWYAEIVFIAILFIAAVISAYLYALLLQGHKDEETKRILEAKRLEAEEETRLRKAAQEMAELESHLKAEMAQIPEGKPSPVIRLDLDGNILYINPAAEEFVSQTSGYALDYQFLNNIAPILEGLKHSWVTNVTTQEMSLENIHFLQTIQPFESRNKKSVVVYYTDISAVKKAQKVAEQANATKSDFLANMSHELRTPLNSIIGMVQILDMQKFDSDTRESFDLIKMSARSLLDIVDDILDLSKIEAGEIHLEYRAFDAIQKIRHTVNSLKSLAREKGLELSYVQNIGPTYVLGDELRFARILMNLVSNAVRYTEEGYAEVCVQIKETQTDQILVRCEVKDTGIGIAPDKIDRIFEKFTQADTSITRKFGGTGLGLAITKQLVELMGGEIGVKSELGKGSTFWFEIPFETVGHLPETEKGPRLSEDKMITTTIVPIADARILMAEDHTMNQLFMKKLFSRIGVENYTIVKDGLEALHEIETNNYDLVLMDCHMPEMDGYEATVAIRKLPDTIKSAIPIIAMTANAMPEDEAKCLNIGMDAYLAKPIYIDVFKQKLSPWIKFNDEGNQGVISAETDSEANEKIVNLDNLRENAMGDEDFVRDMVRLFITQGAQQLAALEAECIDGENNEWVEISHALKGTAVGVGAISMRDLCADAQDMLNAPAKDRKNMLKKIQIRYDEAKQFFIDDGLFPA